MDTTDRGPRSEQSPSREFRFALIEGQKEQAQFESVLNEAFPVVEGSRFFDDFPLWDESHQAQVVRLGCFDGNQIVATAGARVGEMKTPHSTFPVVTIGAVATRSSHRGLGLASELVGNLLEWAKGRGAYIAVLWGSEHHLYGRLGFHLCGLQSRLALGQIPVAETIGPRIEEGWEDSIFDFILKNRSLGFSLEDRDRSWFSSHKNVQWFTTGEGSNFAYAALGRGMDLKGMVHEWGGNAEGLRFILREIARREPNAEILGNPYLLTRSGFNAAHGTIEYQFMAKVLNPEENLQKILTAFNVPVRIQKNPKGWEVLSGSLRVQTPEVHESIFGPKLVSEELIQYLPLPLWFWGLDAV